MNVFHLYHGSKTFETVHESNKFDTVHESNKSESSLVLWMGLILLCHNFLFPKCLETRRFYQTDCFQSY